MKRIVNKFPDELKRKVIEEYLTTNKSQKQLREEYNFRGSSTISYWMRTFGIAKPTQQEADIQNIMSKESSKTQREIELETKIEALIKDLDTERFRVKALNKMIDIIERDLNIPVRKKPGTKQ